LLHSCIENDINFNLLDPNWDKHLPKVIKRKEEEDKITQCESENEEKEIHDEPNHDPCQDFEFDKTGARINKFPYENRYKMFAGGYMCEC
jgi:hypothetical protein